jgi:hypothetical protein
VDSITAAIVVAIIGAIVAGIFGVFGAAIGGIFAIVGGYLAARYTVDREKESKERDQFEDFVAAVRVVRVELASNITVLDTYLKFGGQLVHELGDDQLRGVQLVLFRRLPEQLRVQVVHAYHMVPLAIGNVQFIASGTSSNPVKAKRVIKDVRDELQKVNVALASYLAVDLKVAMI